MSRRDDLHRMVDELPDDKLECAQRALVHCVYPEQLHLTIEQARRRVLENSKRRLREYAERTGQGFVSSVGSGGGSTNVIGNHHSSMVAFEDGKDATYHLYIYNGTKFEIIETLEDDGQRIMRGEKVIGPAGTEQVLMAEIRKATE